MRHETEVDLIRRALSNIDQGKSDADGEPFELAAERYLDPDRLERERALLHRLPVVVGFASQVARPGDFITHDHAGVPLIVARDRSGVLRAFLNACRHRGTRLLMEPCGSTERSIVCPYHGWSYGLTGRLEGVPHRNEFAGVDLTERGLIELEVRERFGLLFARLTSGPFEECFASFAEDLDGFGLPAHVLFAPTERSRRLNWKLMLDGSWESYHFRTTHAKTIASRFFDNTGVFDWAEPNLRMVLPKRTMLELSAADPATWQIRPHANLLYGIFPNTILLVQPDEAIFWTAIEEDVEMGERIQSSLSSGATKSLLFGKSEHLIGKYQRAIERRLQ